MAVFEIDLRNPQCHHAGATKGNCRVPSCRNFSGVQENSLEFFFGKHSTGAAAMRLYNASHTPECFADKPCRFHLLQSEARSKGLIF